MDKRKLRKLPPEMKAKQWVKGQKSPNPEGGRKHNPIQRALRNLTVETYREVIELVLTGNMDALKDMIEDPKAPAIQVGVARAFFNALKSGDYAVIERITERIVGKIPDVVQVNSQNNTNINAKVAVLDKEKLKAALKSLEDEV